VTVYFNSGATGTYFGSPTGTGLSFNTGKFPLNWPLLYRELDTSTVAVVNTASVKPSTQRKVTMDNLVRGLKATGIWNSLDLLYVLANENTSVALLNWKNPSTFAPTPTNSPVFEANRGYTGNGSSSYLATTWNFSTNAVQFTQNSAMIGVWNRTPTPLTTGAIGTDTTLKTTLTPRGGTGGNSFRFRITCTAPLEPGTIADASGLSVANRTASNAIQGYKNGALVGAAGTTASEAIESDTLSMGKAAGFFFNGQMAVGLVGAGLVASSQTSLYTNLQNYLRAVGAA